MDKNMSSSNFVQSQFVVDPRFINLRPVGHGGNAVVYSAMDSECDKEVAIKKLSFCDRQGCKYALRELCLMRRLQHENVITVYEVLGSNGFSLEKGGNVNFNVNEMSSVYLVQELLHTDLHQLVQQHQLTKEHIRLFSYQLLRGLKYIHSANVVHRDLKPMNLLINVEDLVLKIGDFGLARVIDSEYCHKGFLTDNVGTCWYRSPELILSPREYTKSIDMWSVGCILAEMLIGKPMFPGAHEMDQIGLILDSICLSDNEWNKVTQILPQSFVHKHSRIPVKPLSAIFTSVDIDALDLLEKLLVFEPTLRISAEDALAHPYLQQFSCVEDEPIVLTPFHIEDEVDDLSPQTARRMISNQLSKSVETCGSKNPTIVMTTNAIPPAVPKSSNPSLPTTDAQGGRVVTLCIADESDTAKRNGGKPELTDNKNAYGNEKKSGSYIEEFQVYSSNTENRQDHNRAAKESKYATEKHRGSGKAKNLAILGIHDIDLAPLQAEVTSSLEKQLKKLQIVVQMPDEENMKEQSSPKENKDEGSEKSKSAKEKENANADKWFVTVDIQAPKVKLNVPKAKDIVNQERQSESPRTIHQMDSYDFVRLEKERLRQLALTEKFRNCRKEKKKKKNRRNNRPHNSGDDGLDFDTLYRLPTEHLTQDRTSICKKDRSVRNVEEQLRLYEELNERRKLVELEKEHIIGAVGGCIEIDESLVVDASRGGNVSPSSEHSRDSSLSNEDLNVP